MYYEANKREIYVQKILALLMLVMFVCCGCGNRKDEPIENDLNTITSRDTVLVGVKTDTYPFGYIDKKDILQDMMPL